MNSQVESNEDLAVQNTSNDAAVSRESAARLGYIDDPFVAKFVKSTHQQRRAPLINRGTYCRFHGVQRVLRQFSQQSPQGQVVVLGAGLDTSYFILARDSAQPARYFEIDFAEVAAKKAATIYRARQLRALLPEDTQVALGGMELHSSRFCLLSGDLRRFTQDLAPKLLEHGLDLSQPTLFVSECVLIYLDPAHSDSILDWITQNMSKAALLTYEQILPDDRFGQMMIENLKNRGLLLRGLHAHPTTESLCQRFLQRGWVAATAIDLAQYHDECIDKQELQRLSKIEFIDEWEEFRLLVQHYAFTFAYTRDTEPFASISMF